MSPSLKNGLAKARALLGSALTRPLAAQLLRPLCQEHRRPPGPLALTLIDGGEAYRAHAQAMQHEYQKRQRAEQDLITSRDAFLTAGSCYVCRKTVDFFSDFKYAFRDEQGHSLPNWRERLVCPLCRLNNRMRASVHIFEQLCGPSTESAIYLTEQTTPVYAWFREHYPRSTGSEYLGEAAPLGTTNEHGIRNESVTRLTFKDSCFDYVISFDVFEHVPEYEKALRECLRCLKPGGTLLFSVPFDHGSEPHIVRARVMPDESIEHILPPEYHGDPLNTAGCLCFYHFGWELLPQLRAIGFVTAEACLYWSREFGYLGGEQIIFIARKGL